MEVAEDISRDRRLKNQGPVRGGTSSRRLRVAIVAPSLGYVGGQSVQADLLARNWEGDPDVQVSFIPVDPHFPVGLRWVRRVRFLRTIVRTPFYLAGLWRGLRDVDVAHIFSASYSSFLVAPLPAWLFATMLGKKTLINYTYFESSRSPQNRSQISLIFRNLTIASATLFARI